jgi:3-oxoadipate enol-lactonase
MSQIQLNNLLTDYTLKGQGARTIVLINGLGLDQHTWGSFADQLSQSYRVLCFDARGVGAAKDNGEAFSTHDMARDVLELCEALDIVRPIVVGFSMGGCVAQHLAVVAPQAVSGLVLLSTVARLSPRSAELIALWRDMMAAGIDRSLMLRNQLLWANEEGFYSNSDTLKTTIDYVLSMPAPESPDGFIRQANACINHDGSLIRNSIGVPTLVLVGIEESVFSVAEAHALSKQIAEAQYQCFDKGGHNLWMEYPHDVANVVAAFVDTLS